MKQTPCSEKTRTAIKSAQPPVHGAHMWLLRKGGHPLEKQKEDWHHIHLASASNTSLNAPFSISVTIKTSNTNKIGLETLNYLRPYYNIRANRQCNSNNNS